MAIVMEAATADRWDELEDFFGPTGAYDHCWCVFFRRRAKDFNASVNCPLPDRGRTNRELLERLTRDGAVPGLVAYRDGQPCGWVSIAPREQFIRFNYSPNLKPVDPDEPDVWSLVCFWTPPRTRRRGVGTVLLEGAVDYARAAGARVVEAYPVDTRGERKAGAAIYRGTITMFERAGFSIGAHPSSGRPIARLHL
jgi:GNAT superfamily N-acetyltransferase